MVARGLSGFGSRMPQRQGCRTLVTWRDGDLERLTCATGVSQRPREHHAVGGIVRLCIERAAQMPNAVGDVAAPALDQSEQVMDVGWTVLFSDLCIGQDTSPIEIACPKGRYGLAHTRIGFGGTQRGYPSRSAQGSSTGRTGASCGS